MTQLPPNDGSRIEVTIKGSASRPVTTDGRVPFKDVTLQAGAQRSHIIPQEVFKNLTDLFQKIGNPDPSSGVKAFDPNNWRDNGQALPSNNVDTNGKSLFDLSQHKGSHPAVNEAVQERLSAIDADLNRALEDARLLNDPNSRLAAERSAVAKAAEQVRNVANAVASISVGGVLDPNNVDDRAIYNITDPNARNVFGPGWDNLSDADKRAQVKLKFEDQLATFVDASGNLTVDASGNLTDRGKLLKTLSDLAPTGIGSLNAADAKIGHAIFAHMTAAGVDPSLVNALDYFENNKISLQGQLADVSPRADKLLEIHHLIKAGKLLGAGVGIGLGLMDLYDDVESVGRVTALARGDATIRTSFGQGGEFSGGGYLGNLFTSSITQTLLGSIPIPNEVTGDIRDIAVLKARVAAYLNQTKRLPGNLQFFVTNVTTKADGLFNGGVYVVHEPGAPDTEHVQVIFRNGTGSGQGDGPVLLHRPGNGDSVVVQDVGAGKSYALWDPGRTLEGAFADLASNDPAKRQLARTKFEQAAAKGVPEVAQTADGRLDPNAVQNVQTALRDANVAPLIGLGAAAVGVPGQTKNNSLVAVFVDGVVQIVRGVERELNKFIGALARGPGVLKDDIKAFAASKEGLLDFADVGQILGSQLSRTLPIKDPWVRIGASTAIGSLLTNIGQTLDLVGSKTVNGVALNAGQAFNEAFKDLGSDIARAGTGAVSSYLVGNLLSELGLKGFTRDAAVAFAGPTLGQIAYNILSNASNLSNASWKDGLTSGFFATAAASFLGTKLADAVFKFDSLTGQIGASVGAAVGTVVATKIFKASLASGNPYAIAASAVIVAVSQLLGGLIGSLFGATTSSATVGWDGAEQGFRVTNVSSRRGGSRDAARQIAGSVAEALNVVIQETQAKLLVPIGEQRFGMRNSDFVYWDAPAGYGGQTRSRNADDIIRFGIRVGLDRMVGGLGGGNVYIKRALLAGLSATSLATFDWNALAGDFAIAKDYQKYLENRSSLNNIIVEFADSSFAAGWVATLARAQELGIDRRAYTDWIGGWQLFLDEMTDGAVDGAGISVALVNLEFREATNERMFGFADLEDIVSAYVADVVDASRVNRIEATAASETIDLRGGRLADQRGYTVDGKLNNDIAVAGSDFTGLATTLNFAAGARRTSVTVSVANDGVAEQTEAFLASLTEAPDMRIIGSAASATIIDGAAARPSLMVGNSFAFESDAFAVFRLSLSKAASTAVTVALSLADDRASGGGVDYGAADAANLQVSADGITWINAASTTFAAGQTELFVRTAIVADNAPNPAFVAGGTQPATLNVEGNERFRLNATVTAGAAALANGSAPLFGTGTIVDGVGSEPLVWIDNVIVDEASGSATFTISRSRTLAAASSVGFETRDRRVLEIGVAATVDAGAGDDLVHASDLGDNIFGGAGNDTLFGGRLDDWLIGGDGNDVLDAGGQAPGSLGGDGNYLAGGSGNDTLRGREGSDWLEGGDGSDSLDGGAGDDILAGGAGDSDSLRGGTGNDQYVVRRGDGLDTLEEEAVGAPVAAAGAGDAITQRMAAIALWRANPNAAGALRPNWVGTAAGVAGAAIVGGDDAIVFGAGIEMGDIRLQRSGTTTAPGNDLIVQVMHLVNGVEQFSGTQLTVRDWFSNPFKRIEWLRFADGTEVRIGDITSFIVGGAGNDVLIGTAGNDFVHGGAGNDRLFLLEGDDIGNGGTGDDMVAGDAGRDLLIGGLGTDELIGGAGNDVLSGDAGADDLYGGSGDDILSGGRGDGDLVVGGAGNDTFKFSRGDGRDAFIDEFINSWSVVWTRIGGFNAAAGIVYNPNNGEVTGPGGVVLRRNVGTALEPDFQWVGRYDYDAATGTLRMFTPPANSVTITANSGTDTIEFAPDIRLQDVILRRTPGTNDLVLAISSENAEVSDTSTVRDSVTLRDWYVSPGQIERLAFYQTGVLDLASLSLFAGTDGNDNLAGSSSANWVTGGAGDDTIAGGFGNDILAGNSGSDWLRGEQGDDVLYGGAGNDVLDGGQGRDVLVGGVGKDQASYQSTSSAVSAYLSAAWANTGDALGDEYAGIEDLRGGSGGDTLGGDAGDNELTGGVGNDRLLGNAGDDVYIWATGDGADIIEDGVFVVEEAVTAAGALAAGFSVSSWAPTGEFNGTQWRWRLQLTGPQGQLVYDSSNYWMTSASAVAVPAPSAYDQSGWQVGGFARNFNNQQVIRQRFDPAANGGNDELEFGPNITLSNLTFDRSGNDLRIRHVSSTTFSTSQVTIRNQAVGNSAIETLKLADGLAVSLSSIIIATGTAMVTGTAGDDLIVGQTGDIADILSGGDGNDVLIGYGGNDQLSGGNGDDVLEAERGGDILDGGAHGSGGDTVRYVRSPMLGVDVNLALGRAQWTGMFQADTLINIENVVGSGFGDTITGSSANNRLFGLDGNDLIVAGAGNDVLSGDVGNDTLRGEAGDDNLSGGEGADWLYGGSENDLLDGGDGSDQLFGDAGDDRLVAGAGDDRLEGGTGNDVLSGDAGNDTLIAGDGDDILVGGDGNDALSGGAGNDRFLFSRNSGVDAIDDAAGANALQFDDDVSYESLWLTRVGNDLRVAVIGGSAVVTVTGYFAAGGSRVRAVETATHSLFLDHPDTLTLINAMTAATSTPGQTPAALPSTVQTLLPRYWHTGGKARPAAAAIQMTVAEDTSTPSTETGAIDHDNNITRYAISTGPRNGSVTLDAATGRFVYTPASDFHGTDSFVIAVIDADNQSADVRVDVVVTPVNDAPRDIRVAGGGGLSVLEGAPGSSTVAGTVVGQVLATDPEGDAFQFALINTSDNRFAITSNGEVRVVDPARLDRESQATHVIRVRVTDSHGAATEADLVVTIGNVNEAPDVPVLATSQGIVSEAVNANLANLSVARFNLNDIDGTPPSLRLRADAGNWFMVEGNEVRFIADRRPDFETLYRSGLAASDSDGDGLFEVILNGTVDAFDGELASATAAAFAIRIEDVNEAPTALNWTPQLSSVAERDRVRGTTLLPAITIGTLDVVDPDIAGFATASYSFTVSDPRFEVVGNQLRLRQGAALDFEAGSSVAVTVTATDQTAAPLAITRTLSILVDNQDDVLEGNSEANTLVGQQNRDIIEGFAGNDVIDGASGDDLLDGGSGDDQLLGGAGSDQLIGGLGDDRLDGGIGNDRLAGGDGNDRLFGGDGADELTGDAGDDWLTGGAGADRLDGGAGSDWADYAQADTTLAATAGVTADLAVPNDNSGAAAGDVFIGIENLSGSGFADTLRGDGASNQLAGNGGDDVLVGRGGNDILVGGDGNDQLFGDDGDDRLEGGSGDDIIRGGAGNDTLLGGEGADQLYAESGDDFLDGGAGSDVLHGGLDNDTYIVTRTSGADTIINFDPSGDDIDVLGFQDSAGAINDRDLWFERVGNDMRISVIATNNSVLIKDWYVISDPGTRANYKIDFIVAGQRSSKQINVEGLVGLMATRARPTTLAQRDALMADLSFIGPWEEFWGINADPVLSAVANQVIDEDGNLTLSFTASDDLTPAAGVQIGRRVVSGGDVIDASGIIVGAPNEQGVRTLTLQPRANASGVAVIELSATDAGGRTVTRQFSLTVNPVADRPTMTFAGGSGTAAQVGGIGLGLNVDFRDLDGSEVHEIELTGIPAAVSLTAGVRNAVTGAWQLTPAQLASARLVAPAGWSQDLVLTAIARAREAGQTAVSDLRTATIVINAPPTGANLSGSVNENAANGSAFGLVTAVDPDAGDTFSYSLVSNAAGRFAIDANGTLRAANGSLLNFEAATAHSITVRVSDSFGQTRDVAFSVNVNNVNEANSLPAAYSFTTPENTAANPATGVLVGTVQASDLDSAGTVFAQQRYFFLHNGAISANSWDGRYRIDPVSGAIVTNATLDFEGSDPTRTYSVAARDNAGGLGFIQATTNVTIALTNRNEPNSLPASHSFNVAEGAAAFRPVGSVVASDIDSASSVFGQQRYSFLHAGSTSLVTWDGRYQIDALTGNITTTAQALDSEGADPTRTYNVIARDNAGAASFNQASTNVTIAIANINQPNSLQSSYNFPVLEGQNAGRVGTVQASDLDRSAHPFAQQRYYFMNNGVASLTSWDGRYRINVLSGEISANGPLDFESADPTRTYSVIARDNTDVTVPYDLDGRAAEVYRLYNIALGRLPNAGEVANWTWRMANLYGNGPTALESIANEILGDAGVQARMSANNVQQFVTRVYQIGFNRNPQPSEIDIWVNALNSGTSRGFMVALFVNHPDHRAIIDPSLRSVVAAAESQPRNQAQTSVSIAIQNVNEPHSIVSGSGRIFEGKTYGGPALADTFINLRTVMQLNDLDSQNAIEWSFADGTQTNGIWTIVRDTGHLHFSGGVDFEALTTRYETRVEWDPWTGEQYEISVAVRDLSLATHNLQIRAFDGRHSAYANFEASVGDANEAPRLAWTPRFIVRDDQPNGFLGQLFGIDPETGAGAVSYSIELISSEEQFASLGGGTDIDNTSNPFVSVNPATGALSFFVANDGEWEGGIRNHPVFGGRWSYQLVYRMRVIMTDAFGNENSPEDRQEFEIIFLKHNTSGVLPIMLDLDGDGIELVALEDSTVTFDMDRDGIADKTGWVGADDGMLVLDRNENGLIDDSHEISFASDDEQAITDLEGLRAWDTNRNGLLDAGDADFSRFQVWRDINQNGISEAGELFSLSQMGIRTINLTLNLTGEELVGYKNVLFATSQFTRADGTTGLVGDVSLAFEPSKPVEVEAGPGAPGAGATPPPPPASTTTAAPPAPAATPLADPAQSDQSEEPGESSGDDLEDDEAPPANTGLAAPIVFDLDGDDAALVSPEDSQTRFDMNGDGIADKTGWIEADDGFLALDRNGNGTIDDINEISFVGDLPGAKTDLEGLAAFDSNADAVLDGNDERFVEFRLWRDINSNGQTDAGELLSLAEAGIRSISLRGTPTGEQPVPGRNIVFNTANFTLASGATGKLLDAGLSFTALSAFPEIEIQTSDWEGRARHYRLNASGGLVQLALRRARGAVNAEAGRLGPAALYTIGGRTLGSLSTILIDLDGDGLEARRSGKTNAQFDMNGDGLADDTGWMADGDGMLVIDRNQDGLITDLSEISFLSEKQDATSAWDGLSVLDNNRDGRITSMDARFGELKVWTDRNADGVTQPGELRSLADLGITEINLRQSFTNDSARVGDNLAVSTASFRRENGVTGTIGNVALGFAAAPAPATPNFPAGPDGTPEIPEAVRMANQAAANLAQAMSVFGVAGVDGLTSSEQDPTGMGTYWLSVAA